ncbi:MAG: hypothetical protein RMA76_32045 [Deltaproteobacteria bacterium]
MKWLKEAVLEYEAAAFEFRAESPSTADRFARTVDRRVRFAERFPRAGTQLSGVDAEVRRFIVDRFPYKILIAFVDASPSSSPSRTSSSTPTTGTTGCIRPRRRRDFRLDGCASVVARFFDPDFVDAPIPIRRHDPISIVPGDFLVPASRPATARHAWTRDREAARQKPELAVLAHGNEDDGLDAVVAAVDPEDGSRVTTPLVRGYVSRATEPSSLGSVSAYPPPFVITVRVDRLPRTASQAYGCCRRRRR